MAKSVVEIRKRFSEILKAFIAYAKNKHKLLTNQAPELVEVDLNGWSGNNYDTDTIHKFYSRDEHSADVQRAISAPDAGSELDLAASQLQADFLACAEREHYNRVMTPVRAALHSAARWKGHAHPQGVLQKGIRGSITDLIARNKSEE